MIISEQKKNVRGSHGEKLRRMMAKKEYQISRIKKIIRRIVVRPAIKKIDEWPRLQLSKRIKLLRLGVELLQKSLAPMYSQI